MRDYKEFYREAKGDKTRIYCDMDGVLCDFIAQSKKATGKIFTQDKAEKALEKARDKRKIGPGGGGRLEDTEIESIERTNDRLSEPETYSGGN